MSEPGRTPGSTGGWRAALLGALALGAVCIVVVGCGGSSSKETSTANTGSDPAYGSPIDQKVPAALERIPLTNQRDEKVDLASWSGKTVMLVPFLTLCADICPFTTGILLQVEKTLRADHAASKVKIVELTVDPHRDSPARLAAYGKLTHAGWELVTETPAHLATLAKFFGFSYEKIAEGNPPSIDWWTGKPLTYDVDHSDNYFVIDPSGNERVVQDAAPDFHGKLAPKLQKFLSPVGRQHQKHPPQPDWTTADALAALSHVLHQELPVATE
ncbi:MAG TPA: SCO family protein [Solirubrobacterales bacterium]|nr:SCO family protein [Solirubrobacterales bacterium]